MNDKATILVVDDLAENLHLLEEVLTRDGYEVRLADSGELALTAAVANPPDLILLGTCMQGVDGLELCSRLKGHDELRHIPVILTCATSGVLDAVKGLQLGAADYIEKPFQSEAILSRVKAHLALSRANAALARQATEILKANAQLQAEIAQRKRLEGELRQSRDHAERSRLTLLSAMEDQQRKSDACVLNAQRVESLLQLNRMIASTPQELSDYALEESVRLTRSKIGYLAFLNEDESVLIMNSWSKSAMGACAMTEKTLRFPVADTGLWGEAVRQRQAVITNDYAADNPLKKGCPQGHVPLKRHMNVPVFAGSRIVIVAGVGNKDGEYDQEDVRALTLLMEGLWHLLEHRRADKAIRESEQRYRSLFLGMNEGFALHELLFDEQGQPCDYIFLTVNPAFERLTGLKAENLIGASQRQIMPDESPFWLDVYSKVAQTGESIRVEHYSPQLQRYFEVFAYCPAPNRFATVFNDITERKHIEEVQVFLAQTGSGGETEPFFNALARYLAQSLNVDFVCIDRLEGDGLNARTLANWCDGRFEDNITYALKDTPCGDAVGKQICCFPSSVCELFPNDQVLKNMRAESYMGVTLFGHTGKPIGLIALIGRAPLVNRSLAETVLKQVVIRASGEIEREEAEVELQKIEKLQSIGTLAGGIAHDFNNILLGLFGNISLAMDELSKDHPSYAPLEEAERAMSRAVRLTKQLLTFSQGGAPVKENVGLADMVEEVARFDLAGSNVSLVFHCVAELWPAEADKGQIQQVISNLVINARQAMPKGGRLTITLENAVLPAAAVPFLKRGRYVKVIVRDEGCGIEPKAIDRIFDPYFTTKQTGHGLGLATVWSIINKHNGHIGVVSELGKGSTFTLYLPASSSLPPAAVKPSSSDCPPRAIPAKILLMDDEESVNRLVVRMLAPLGYSVAVAPSAHAAIELYSQALKAGVPFDAVIMDLTIPGGRGGKEAIQDLLKLDPSVRAIVSSGYAEDPIMSDPAAYGFKGTIAKPYTAGALREALARVLA